MRSFLCSILFFAAGALTAPAQVIDVQNGTSITLEGGTTWNLEGGRMDFGPTGETARIDERGPARVLGGALTVIRVLDAPTAANPAGLGAILTSAVELGATTVTRGHTIQTGTGNESIARYYDVSPSFNTDLSATLTFTYADAELNGLDERTLVLFRSANGGTTWTLQGQDSRDATANVVTLRGIDVLSRWTLGSEDSPLPVELSRIRAEVEVRRLRLLWETASETNNAGFEVERQSQGTEEWEKIGFVEGHGTTAEARSYVFVDRDLPYTSSRLSYRLRQVDLDGTAEYSRPIEVTRPAPERLRLHEAFPNPVGAQATIRYELSAPSNVHLAVFDGLGRRVVELADGRQPSGRNEILLNTSGLSSGLYVIRLAAEGHVQTQKLMIVR